MIRGSILASNKALETDMADTAMQERAVPY